MTEYSVFELVSSLLETVQLPSLFSVIKCQAHTPSKDKISLGNAKADCAAKRAASSSVPPLLQMAVVPAPTNFFIVNYIIALQATADPSENRKWAGCCHKDTPGVWSDEWSRPAMPRCTFHFLAKWTYWLCEKMTYYSIPSNWGETYCRVCGDSYENRSE
jgi:hypothetical protein